MDLKDMIRSSEKAILDMMDRLDPPCCLFCGNAGFEHMDVCHTCYQAWPLIIAPCPRCALGWAGRVCAICSTTPPLWQAAVIPFRYMAPMATLITDLKYQARFMAARILARSFCDGLNAVSPPHDKPQLLIPIPLHYTKQRRRGFNQTCVLGRPVARHLGIPLAPHALRRHGIAPPQVGLSGAARRRNVKDAFIANTAVRGMHVALFDDVVTTGATAMAASIALLEAGAARVDLWAVARAEGPLTGLRSARGLPRAQEEKGST